MNKLKKFSLSRLFDNNKFVFVISLILAFVIWLSYSMYGGEQQEKTIDVPISMDSMTVPKQFNLQQFGDYSNSAVSVTIVGKKAVIGTVTKDDIKVTASTLDVNTAGKHTLPLSVSVDSNKDFQILSTNTLSVEVYFDVYKEVTVSVNADLSATPSVPNGYELGTVIMSADKLLAYGPSTEVSKIDKILARADIEENLTSTASYKATIVAIDKYGNEIQNITIKDSDDFTITIPVFKLANLPVSVEFTNMPDGVSVSDLNISYSVKNMNIAGEEATIDKMESVVIGTIDFSELKDSANSFSFNASSIAGIKVKSNISSIIVKVDLSSFKTYSVTIPASQIEIVNSGTNTPVINDKSFTIRLAGLSDDVKTIKASDISAVLKIDSDQAPGENQLLELSVKVSNKTGIWVIGQYNADVTIS